MTRGRPIILLLMCGMLITAATALCQGETVPAEVPALPQELLPSAVPERVPASFNEPAPVKADKKVMDRAWYWRFMEGIVMDAARYNTDKQSDGRPLPQNNPR